MAGSFQEAHFPQAIIRMGVRWYVAYPLSTRHVEELIEERRLDVHFISSLPVILQSACKAWVDRKPVQIVAAED